MSVFLLVSVASPGVPPHVRLCLSPAGGAPEIEDERQRVALPLAADVFVAVGFVESNWRMTSLDPGTLPMPRTNMETRRKSIKPRCRRR